MAESSEPSSTPARPFLEIRPLLRALGIASDSKKLILTSLGLLALWAGWSILARITGEPILELPSMIEGTEFQGIVGLSSESLVGHTNRIAEPFRVIVTPFTSLVSQGLGWTRGLQIALMAVWAVVVWGVIGGAIARIAVVQAAGDHRVGLASAVEFALKKWLSLVGAPLTPLFGVSLFAAACAVFGLVSRIPWGVGSTFAAIFGFVPLFLGLAMAFFLVGLALGWPLMHATVAAEGEDAPDALSRAYSYVNQRLPRYAAHVLASYLIGAVGLFFVTAFAGVVVTLADWGVGLGSGASAKPNDMGVLFWRGVVASIVHAWAYSYFWSSASIIYLILRRDVDGTPWHDVYLPEQEADTFAGDQEIQPIAKTQETEAASVG